MKRVSNSSSERHNHFGSLPNDLDGMSVIAFCDPAMCNGVSGDAFALATRSDNARSSWAAITLCLLAWRRTHATVGELSLKSATCFRSRVGQTSSMTSQRSKSPAISRSEFVIFPPGFSSDTSSSCISLGQGILNTVGMQLSLSPMMIPPTPCFDASFTPTKWGQLCTSWAQWVGKDIVSRMRVRISVSACMRALFRCRKTTGGCALITLLHGDSSPFPGGCAVNACWHFWMTDSNSLNGIPPCVCREAHSQPLRTRRSASRLASDK